VSYAIIGFGAVGQALAAMFARKGIEISVASRRPPEALAAQAKAIGPTVTPKTLEDALEADVIMLAVPFWQHRDVAGVRGSWQGKIVIDVTNAYGVPVEDLGGLPSSVVIAQAFSGAQLVKAFNHLPAATLAAAPAVNGGRRVIFVASDDDTGAASVKAGGTTWVRAGLARKTRGGRHARAGTGPELDASDFPGFLQAGAVKMYDHVIWPERYDPKNSAIYALNDIDVKAPAEVVWKLLVEAENWSSYFPPEDQVHILNDTRELMLGTRYSRMTVGFPMSLTVTECEPFRRLAWATTVDGDETGSSAYHGWVITPTDEGCHVLTEETQQGDFFLDILGHKHPGGLYRYHQDWVERLAQAAEAEVANKAG